jgi:hypothetical protein
MDAPATESIVPRAKRRLAELSVQSEMRDLNQVDIRFSYALAGEESALRYTVDTFLFIPRNVGVNRSNYSREQFYADVTALMRLDAKPLPLERLADPSCDDSPMHVLAQILSEFRTARRPPDSRLLIAHVKLYAYLFTVGARSSLQRGGRAFGKSDEADASDADAAAMRLEATLAAAREALRVYRSMRGSFWPFERVCHESMPEAMRAADEYMSLVLEERLARLSARLERRPPSLAIARARLAIRGLAREEAAYRRKYGYLVFSGDRPTDGEYFSFRSSMLKKAVQQALYLDAREVKADVYLRNAVGMVGATLAAIWALAAQIPLALARASSDAKLLFLAIPVLAYVMKDRIKVLTNEHLVRKLRRFDHTSWLSGASLREVGLGMMTARVREAMRFLSVSQVPGEVRRSRLSHRTIPHADFSKEEVIHYQKVIDVGARRGERLASDAFWVRDIFRLNVKNLLTRLDEPVDEVSYYDERRHGFRATSIPKVYHVNVVVRLRRQSPDGEATSASSVCGSS